MSKAILILDEIPESCLECPIGHNQSLPLETCIYCAFTHEVAIDDEAESRPGWCPLCEMADRVINTNLCDTCKNSVAINEGKYAKLKFSCKLDTTQKTILAKDNVLFCENYERDRLKLNFDSYEANSDKGEGIAWNVRTTLL